MSFWKSKFGQYVYNNLIALDQTWNARAGGDPDETISSRIGKIQRENGGTIPWSRPLARMLCSALNDLQPGHCINAIEDDEGKDQVAPR